METLKTFFKTLLNRYQNNLEISIRGNNFFFDCINLLSCKCHKINWNRGGSYADSPDWMKNKKSSNKLYQ